MTQQGRLEAIWVKRFKRGPMDPKSEATLVGGRGIEGNANQGGKRQVTLISKEMWEKLMNEVGGDKDPSSRRANLMVSGVDLNTEATRMMVFERMFQSMAKYLNVVNRVNETVMTIL